MEQKTILTQLGLTPKEVTVYTALLKQGETHVVPIVKETGLPRTTVVYLLEQLAEKQLVQIIQQHARRIYIPEPPKSWVSTLRKQQTIIENRIQKVEQSLPELNQLYAASPLRPEVRYYRGRSQLRELYNEMLAEPVDEIWYVGAYHSIIEILGEPFLKQWVRQRIAKRIKTRSIRLTQDRDITEPVFRGGAKTKRTVRYAPADFTSPGHVVIYGDCVAVITTSKENFGVVTRSRDYSTIMKSWFTQLWKVSTTR